MRSEHAETGHEKIVIAEERCKQVLRWEKHRGVVKLEGMPSRVVMDVWKPDHTRS